MIKRSRFARLLFLFDLVNLGTQNFDLADMSRSEIIDADVKSYRWMTKEYRGYAPERLACTEVRRTSNSGLSFRRDLLHILIDARLKAAQSAARPNPSREAKPRGDRKRQKGLFMVFHAVLQYTNVHQTMRI